MPRSSDLPLVRECKYVAERGDPLAAAAILEAWSAPDPGYPEGELESVYFDSPGLSSWREKADGDAFKRKVRVRWYRGSRPGPDGTIPAYFEVKDRICAARDKKRARFAWDAAFLESAPLEDPGFARLLAAGAKAADAEDLALSALVPVVSIRYRRRRYVCPATGSRLSLDSRIRCPRANGAVLPFAGPLESGAVVVEAKSDEVRSWPFGPSLLRAGFAMRSFSKFGHFMEQLVNGAFR